MFVDGRAGGCPAPRPAAGRARAARRWLALPSARRSRVWECAMRWSRLAARCRCGRRGPCAGRGRAPRSARWTELAEDGEPSRRRRGAGPRRASPIRHQTRAMRRRCVASDCERKEASGLHIYSFRAVHDVRKTRSMPSPHAYRYGALIQDSLRLAARKKIGRISSNGKSKIRNHLALELRRRRRTMFTNGVRVQQASGSGTA